MVVIFTPYPSFEDSLKCLDNQRLGKQRLEAKQAIQALINPSEKKGYRNHPAVKSWQGYENALISYYNMCIDVWVERGCNNTMEKIDLIPGDDGKVSIVMPWFIGWEPYHKSHQASLTRKHPHYYKPIFEVEGFYMNRGYIWPSHHDFSVRDISIDVNSIDASDVDFLFAPINMESSKNASQSGKRMYTVVQLRAMCKERGIRGYSGKKKDELLEMLGISFE